jgi:PAS domain S-box-containing protein
MPTREMRTAPGAKRLKVRRQQFPRMKNPGSDRYHTFAEDAPDSMMIIEGSGRFIAMNASARRMLGYSWQDLPELDLETIGAKAIRDRLKEFRRIGRVRFEATALRKDGRALRLVFHTAAMGDGSFQILLAEIENRDRPVDALFEDAPLPIVEAQLSSDCFVVERINREARSFLGGGGTFEFVGKSFSSLFCIRDEDLAGLLLKARRGDGVCEGGWILKDHTGANRHCRICVTLSTGTDDPKKRAVFSFIDVTDEKLREMELAGSLEAKSLLLRESQHRVKNSLNIISSMLSLQRGALQDENCAQLLLAAQLRIQAIALYHDHLSRVGSESLNLELSSYLGDLVCSIKKAYVTSEKPIRIDTSIAELRIDSKRAATIGLIVNELITNSLKYAFPSRSSGTLWVRAREAEGILELSIADDGVGLAPSFNWRESKGLGFKLIELMSQQLSATVKIEGENGFRFSMGLRV